MNFKQKKLNLYIVHKVKKNKHNIHNFKFKKFINIFFSISCLVICLASLVQILPERLKENSITLSTIAAGINMPDGAKLALKNGIQEINNSENIVNEENDNLSKKPLKTPAQTLNNNAQIIETCKEMPGVIPEAIPNANAENGQATHPIIEKHINNDGDSCGNVSLKNYSKTPINIEDELSKSPDLKFKLNAKDPQILIYHTHTTEAYLPQESSTYPDNLYSRTTDKSDSVVAAGENICKKLQANGISSIHDTTIHDNPSYNGSYNKSSETIHSLLEQYPSVIATIDIHRDAIGNNSSRTKTIFNYGNQKAAQIMIICGCGETSVANFPNWRENLRFGLKLQQKLADNYPGMARSLKFCDRLYNLNATKGSILIEIGTDVNSLDEALKSADILGEQLAQVIKSLTN